MDLNDLATLLPRHFALPRKGQKVLPMCPESGVTPLSGRTVPHAFLALLNRSGIAGDTGVPHSPHEEEVNGLAARRTAILTAVAASSSASASRIAIVLTGTPTGEINAR